MNCRDFERAWNEQLDARAAASPDPERSLEEHASACPSCRALAVRYQSLRQAIRSLGPAPAPAADFAARVLDVHQGSPRFRIRRVLAPLAAAAALFLVALWGGWGLWRSVESPRMVEAGDPNSPPWTDALADATSATWELARAASAPAARIGREALDSAVESEAGSATRPDPVALGSASEILHTVGERVNQGVRPLSGTARHAFGFLLDAAPGA